MSLFTWIKLPERFPVLLKISRWHFQERKGLRGNNNFTSKFAKFLINQFVCGHEFVGRTCRISHVHTDNWMQMCIIRKISQKWSNYLWT
jgi:hypothetical protein